MKLKHWLALLPLVTALNQPAQAQDLHQEMRKAGNALSALVPYIYDDTRFRAVENQSFITSQLDQLIQSMEKPDLLQQHAVRQISQASLVDQLKQVRQTNGYWLGALSGAQTDPRRLDSVRTHIAHYAGVKPEDLMAAARKYLIADRAWKFEVLPEPTIAAAEPAGGSAAIAATVAVRQASATEPLAASAAQSARR